MNIVIVGAGEVGTYLAVTLSREEHNVIVVDRDAKALEKLSSTADVATRLGSGTHWQLLEELLEQSPDLFVALTSQDETNLVACSIAKNLGYPRTVARVHEPSFLNRSKLDFNRLFFADHLIGTEMIAASDIYKCICNPGNTSVENFAHGTMQMRSMFIQEASPLLHRPIAALKLPEKLLIGLIRRKQKSLEESIIFPKGQDVLLPGDEVTLIGETSAVLEGAEEIEKPKSVIVAGGTGIALHLCEILVAEGIDVRLIDPDESRCEWIAENLPSITVLHQDPADLDFLMAERVASTDVVVSCFASNEKNIVVAALAKQAGAKEVIAVVSDEGCFPLLRQLGIFYAISEKVSVVNRIHAILREDSVVSVASLYQNKAQIMEVKVSKDSPIVGIPLSDLKGKLPQDFLIALIENRGKIMVAKGSNILAPGDTAIVICPPTHVEKLHKLF